MRRRAAEKQRLRQIVHAPGPDAGHAFGILRTWQEQILPLCDERKGTAAMRVVLAGCALLLACSVEPACAQEGWPLSVFKQSARKPPPKKANAATPPNATALLDPQAQQAQPQPAP